METDEPTDGQTQQSESIIAPPPKFCGGGIITRLRTKGAVYVKELVGRSVWAHTVLPGQVLKDGALSSMSRTSTISRNWLVSDEFIVSVARICSCSWENNRRVSTSSEENTCNKVKYLCKKLNHCMDIMKWWNVWLFTNSLTWARSCIMMQQTF